MMNVRPADGGAGILPDPEFIDHLVDGHRLRMEAARRVRMEARRANTVLPPPNPLLAVTIDDEPPVPLQ